MVFNKTIAGRRRTWLLNVKPARMSVKKSSSFWKEEPDLNRVGSASPGRKSRTTTSLCLAWQLVVGARSLKVHDSEPVDLLSYSGPCVRLLRLFLGTDNNASTWFTIWSAAFYSFIFCHHPLSCELVWMHVTRWCQHFQKFWSCNIRPWPDWSFLPLSLFGKFAVSLF